MKVISFLTSRGVAVFLLAFSVILLVAWTRYPGFYSIFFLIVPFLVLLSLLFCTIKRIVTTGRCAQARFWGSIIFHIGMIIGVCIIFLSPLARFSARVSPLEGATTVFNDKDAVTVMETPAFGSSAPEISLKLNSYEIEYKDGVYPTDYSAYVTVGFLEGDEYKKTDARVRINGPLNVKGYQFLLESGGYAPLFTLFDNDDRVIFKSYVRLANITRIEDSFEIKRAGLIVYTRFFPDIYRKGDKVGNRSRALKNPAFGIKVVRKDDRKTDIFSGVLKKGESAVFEGMRLEFTDLKSFVVLSVVKDPLYWWLFAGWGIGLLGLIIRYMPAGIFKPMKTKDIKDIKERGMEEKI